MHANRPSLHWPTAFVAARCHRYYEFRCDDGSNVIFVLRICVYFIYTWRNNNIVALTHENHSRRSGHRLSVCASRIINGIMILCAQTYRKTNRTRLRWRTCARARSHSNNVLCVFTRRMHVELQCNVCVQLCI